MSEREEKGRKHAAPADPPRQQANKARGHGTYATDRPPIFSPIERRTKKVLYFVRADSEGATCPEVLNWSTSTGTRELYIDEWGSHWALEQKLKLAYGRVKHEEKEWVRDDDGNGEPEVHCISWEGEGPRLRIYLRAFRGVHKYYLADYVALYETMITVKTIAAPLFSCTHLLRRSSEALKLTMSHYCG